MDMVPNLDGIPNGSSNHLTSADSDHQWKWGMVATNNQEDIRKVGIQDMMEDGGWVTGNYWEPPTIKHGKYWSDEQFCLTLGTITPSQKKLMFIAGHLRIQDQTWI